MENGSGSEIFQISCRHKISGLQLDLVIRVIRSKNSVNLEGRLWMLSERSDKFGEEGNLLQKAIGSI